MIAKRPKPSAVRLPCLLAFTFLGPLLSPSFAEAQSMNGKEAKGVDPTFSK